MGPVMFEIYFIVALVVAITVHEFSHAWVANYLGDPTAKYQGRVTLNPLKHLDLMGTIMLFIVGLGWGKPVPVNPANLQNPRRDGALVAIAGPASNILVAIVIALPYKYLLAHYGLTPWVGMMRAIFDLNLLLAIFNMIPLPPLDGSKIIGLFLKDHHYENYMWMMRHGTKYFVAFILIDIFVLGRMFGVSLIWMVIGTVYQVLSSLILLGT